MPQFCIKGIRYLAKRVKQYPENRGDRRAALYLAMYHPHGKKIGTGGAEFRFMYAAFLTGSRRFIEE